MGIQVTAPIACPRCGGPLQEEGGQFLCQADALHFPVREGIPDLIDPSRRGIHAAFLDHYTTSRHLEGWGCPDPAYYPALPFQDLTGRFASLWRIRAKSFLFLLSLLRSLGGSSGRALSIVDLGAGNGWLSARLASEGFQVWAVDLSPDARDGLGCAVHYPVSFPCALAEFERLPFLPASFDAAVFNASFHYAADPVAALQAAARVLTPEGSIFIADSPIYQSPASGTQMVLEMRDRLTQGSGLKSWVQPGPGFLTFSQIDDLASRLRVRVRLHRPQYGMRWRLRPFLAGLRGAREPASFQIVEFVKPGV